jgi:endogenous inhibitor of DNA gyrase (YacG/DUF329 family)
MSELNVSSTAKCPYCGNPVINRFNVECVPFSTSKRVLNCDVEGGGCDEDFVVYVRVDVHTVSYGLDFKKSVGSP